MIPPSIAAVINIASCVACGDVTPSSAERGNFFADCDAGRCVVSDVRETSLVSCNSNQIGTPGNCVLRAGLDCCERCDLATGITAVNADVDINAERSCLEGACPPCVPIYPEPARAVCDLDAGRCAVLWDGTATD